MKFEYQLIVIKKFIWLMYNITKSRGSSIDKFQSSGLWEKWSQDGGHWAITLKNQTPPVEDLCFWGFYPSGMQKNLCNWPLWKRLEPPLEVHFCFLTPLERAFFFHFSQLPLWKKWLISPLENEVHDRGGVRVLNVIAHWRPTAQKVVNSFHTIFPT